MEGREPQQTHIVNGKKACPPRQITFETKYAMLADRAKQIRNKPLSTPCTSNGCKLVARIMEKIT